ncbi:hypothetical protein SAMN05421747_11948 [Parapedobacter composti]|uniref:Outer membrane protein beta-barrel domain-containing protein n=1 Tax=Parapedobacter composti TaxID=623281 RepID=A0A1I1L771_9SPHI|nr:hypothetical protein [Parapedobacter composti]SFC68876.1 hypothetical protein SAMN05421747_11948 [Parapedobacter composti]
MKNKIIKYLLLANAASFLCFGTLYGQTAQSLRTFMAYSGGMHAPIGMSLGVLSNNGGFAITGRISSNAFNETSIYEMNNSNGINDDFWNFDYTGNNEYRRGSITAAYIHNVGGNVLGTSLHLFGGLGYGFANYVYEYNQIGDSGTNWGTEWIKYTDVSKSGVEVELGIIVNTGSINFNLGYSALNMEDTNGMLTLGLGFIL